MHPKTNEENLTFILAYTTYVKLEVSSEMTRKLFSFDLF